MVFKDFLLTKAESAPLVASLNKVLFVPCIGIAACSKANLVQEASNSLAHLFATIKNYNEQFFFHLLSSCSFTIIAYAMRLRMDMQDTHKVHSFLSLKGFWENKWIINVPSQQST
jgi:hypothetical protein